MEFKVGELNYKIESDSLANNQITVNAGKSISFDIQITSMNSISSKYELYYSVDSEEVLVGYSSSTIDLPSGNVESNDEKIITIIIKNRSSSAQNVLFGVEGGLETNPFSLSSGKQLVEMEDLKTVGEVVFATENLENSCMTYEEKGYTYLVGQCKQNYIWYSGKLWRVVLVYNETGAIKMVTDNVMTMIPYNAANNAKFENSYADQWLQQEFLPTLYHYNDLLIEDSVWYSYSGTGQNPVNSNIAKMNPVTRTVGLLNMYEYYVTYNNSNGLATYSTGYLMNNANWFFPDSIAINTLRSVKYEGWLSTSAVGNGDGIRPAVSLRPDVFISNGTGTINDPYRLDGDIPTAVNGVSLLNSRYSGEYIQFNNTRYRIVDIENDFVKITAVDVPSTLTDIQFDSRSTSFVNASIKSDLENYYQNGFDEESKKMIQENTVWYADTIAEGVSYKKTVCTSVDVNVSIKDCIKTTINTTTANIGLPRFGEMFTSQITHETRSSFWTLTPVSSSYVIVISKNGERNVNQLSVNSGIRPSMYLKQNVVIAKDNTGDGTYEHPYEIELGA